MDVPVLVLSGKGCDKADEARVILFEGNAEAIAYCKAATRDGKYWTHAQIVYGESVSTYKDTLDWCA